MLKNPGLPTPDEVERHNVMHMPFRSWCLACVSWKARDQRHRRAKEDEPKRVPEAVFEHVL